MIEPKAWKYLQKLLRTIVKPKIFTRSKKDKEKEKFMNEYLKWLLK